MKILLLRDDKKLGQKGMIVDVADAYAMNSVIPSGLGKVATPDVIAQVARQQENKAHEQKEDEKKAYALREKLHDNAVVLTRKATDGTLFGAVKEAELAQAISSAYNEVITDSMIDLKSPIKQIGKHEMQITCGPGVAATMTIDITNE